MENQMKYILRNRVAAVAILAILICPPVLAQSNDAATADNAATATARQESSAQPTSGVDAAAPANDAALPDAALGDDLEEAAAPDPADTAETAPRIDPTAANPAPAHPELLPVFKQFGELPGLTALMDDFMIGLLADARMGPFFKETDQVAIKKHLVEQFCVILGGPCTYTGRDMKSSHAGLEINRNNFNALVEVLQVAMDNRGIPFRAQNRLLAKLAPMHREIETK